MAAAATEVNALDISTTLHSPLEDFDTWNPTSIWRSRWLI